MLQSRKNVSTQQRLNQKWIFILNVGQLVGNFNPENKVSCDKVLTTFKCIFRMNITRDKDIIRYIEFRTSCLVFDNLVYFWKLVLFLAISGERFELRIALGGRARRSVRFVINCVENETHQ